MVNSPHPLMFLQKEDRATDKETKELRNNLKDLIVARTSLVYLVSEEDRRVEAEIKALGSR